MAKGLNLNVDKCVERLKDHFSRLQEYKLENEMPTKNGKYAALKIVNENTVIPSLYVLISQRGGILLRFGDLILCSEYPDVDSALIEKINEILSDDLVALVNYENIIYFKSQMSNITSFFILTQDDDKARLDNVMEELKKNVTGIKRLFNKYKGITMVYNWSGSIYEKFER